MFNNFLSTFRPRQDHKKVNEFVDDKDPDSRYIDPAVGLTPAALNQYVPTTELTGMEEWVPESLHYSYYSRKFLNVIIMLRIVIIITSPNATNDLFQISVPGVR